MLQHNDSFYLLITIRSIVTIYIITDNYRVDSDLAKNSLEKDDIFDFYYETRTLPAWQLSGIF